jgi:hypothetical protein
MRDLYKRSAALVPLHSEDVARSFLPEPPRSALTMLISHGWGETEADAGREGHPQLSRAQTATTRASRG